jgi:hypothetical protein
MDFLGQIGQMGWLNTIYMSVDWVELFGFYQVQRTVKAHPDQNKKIHL